MKTGIKINGVEISIGDSVYCSDIENNIVYSNFGKKLAEGVFDSVLIKFIEYKSLNFWSIIIIPYKKNRPVVNGHYMEIAYDESFKKFNEPKIETYQEPPLYFLNSLLSASKNITINDDAHLEFLKTLSFYQDIWDNELKWEF